MSTAHAFRLRWAVVALLLIACLLLWFLHVGQMAFHPRPYRGQDLLSTRDQMPAVQGRDVVSGSKVELPAKRLNFLFYLNFAIPQNVQKIAYACYLNSKYQPTDVGFIVITGGHFPEIEEMHRAGELPFPLIDDDAFAIANRLKLPRDRDGIFLFDRDRYILFSSPTGVFEPEDIRELYERFELGKINYFDETAEPQPAVGSVFPDIEVRELSSNQVKPLSEIAVPGSVDYWLFTADCPICGVPTFFSEIRIARPSTKRPFLPIFSFRFPQPVLRQMATAAGLEGPLYIAQSELSGFEDLYFSRATYHNSSVLVRTNRQRVVTLIQPVLPGEGPVLNY